MQGNNFTERVRKSLAFAREEASLLHHEYVGTEHILLGLIREGEGVASTVLERLDIKPAAVRQSVEGIIKTGKAAQSTGPDLPYTSRAKKVLELAMSEARELGHNYVGTEHLLLGLLREEQGIGAQVLASLGATLGKTRAAVVAALGTNPPVRPAPTGPDYLYGYVSQRASGSGQTSLLLAVSAVAAWIIGIVLILNAQAFEAPMGIVVDDKTATIAQAQGALLLGLGFINWLARGATDRGALWAILYGNFVVQAVSFAVVLRALVQELIPRAGIGALLLHVLLGGAFAWQARKFRRS